MALLNKVTFLLTALLFFSFSNVNAQSDQQRDKLLQLSERLSENAKLQKALARAHANR